MCYYNGVKVTRSEYIRLKELEKAVAQYDFLNKPLSIGFDFGEYPVLKKKEGKNDFEIVKMEWGFIPHYWYTRAEVAKNRTGFKDEKGQWRQYLTLNAVSEDILLPKKMYRDSALKRRCLVLSTGFFEWRHVHRINKRTGQPNKTADKYPYHISLHDREYFYMAGIWNPWVDKETGEQVDTFAIVTTAANRLMEQIHNTKKRMPTILPDELAFEWLFGDLSEERILEIAAYQYPAGAMKAYTVNKDFRAAIDPLELAEYEELPQLENTN